MGDSLQKFLKENKIENHDFNSITSDGIDSESIINTLFQEDQCQFDMRDMLKSILKDSRETSKYQHKINIILIIISILTLLVSIISLLLSLIVST